ncbi:MAG: DUF2442 domain-containing protein [Desulfonatronovibrio sp.]
MNISPEKIWFDEDTLWVILSDGRTVGAPLAWFPRLLHAELEERQDYELSVHGIHWDALDENISVQGLLAGHGDQSRTKPNQAV